MIDTPTIVTALANLGFETGFAASEQNGILLWENDAPEPTHEQLVQAGWTPGPVVDFPEPPA